MVKYIVVGLICFWSFVAGYGLGRKEVAAEAKNKPEMCRGLKCDTLLEESAKCIDDLDRCMENCN